MYKGVPASPGIAIGPALVLPKKQFQLEKKDNPGCHRRKGPFPPGFGRRKNTDRRSYHVSPGARANGNRENL